MTDLRHSRVATLLTLSFLLLGATGGGAQAAGGIECVKTQCESKGRTCVEELYVAYDACMKAGNKKCNGVQLSEKFKCLKTELSPCALTRNAQQDACLADVRTCYASCGPFEGPRADYWCVGEFGNAMTAAFCAADPANARQMDQCEKAMSSTGPLSGGMTCDGL